MAIKIPINIKSDIDVYDSISYFPVVGKEGVLYIVLDTDRTYVWDNTTTSYIEVSSITPVIDNLTSTSITSALSANQGRVLKGLIDNYVETDPVFTASPAFGIASGDITNWDTAYGWGDHASEGYLKNIVEDTTPQLGGDLDTNSNDIKFLDNDKAIFGTGLDFEIYHDTNDTIFRNLLQDKDTIFYVNQLGADTEALRITGRGNVGIGGVTPNSVVPLEVTSASSLSAFLFSTASSASRAIIAFNENPGSTATNFYFQRFGSTHSSRPNEAEMINTTSSLTIRSGAAGVGGEIVLSPTKLLLLNQNVGINVAFANEKLEVGGKIRANSVFNVNGTDGVSGSFTTVDGKTVTVTGGIITAIV